MTTIRETTPNEGAIDPAFPHAPIGWSRASAENSARAEGLLLGCDHYETIRRLHAFFASHQDARKFGLGELSDALDKHFQSRGGIKRLYQIFPGGPIAQGCRLAGLEPPPGAFDARVGRAA